MLEVADPNSNVEIKDFDVTVNADTISPTFDDIPNQIISTSDTDIDWTTYMQNIHDNSCGIITVSEVDAVMYGFVGGLYTVDVSAEDPAGNVTHKQFKVTVQ